MRKVALLLLLALLIFSLHLFKPEAREERLRHFLESQYVPEAGLLRAAVKAYPDNETIYIANDNLLASKALEILNSPLAPRIREKLNEYSGGWNGKVDVLLGKPIEGFYCSKLLKIGSVYSKKFKANFSIMWELTNKTCPMKDWMEYADLIAYAAINATLSGDIERAYKLYEGMLKLWDGHGFRDKAFNGVYQTYKCALFIYVHRLLHKPKVGEEVYRKCSKIIIELQGEDGGIITGYKVKDGKIIPWGDENTETTSIVVLAFYSPGFPIGNT
ncbi:hypothetical protein [Pyrococcus abyssi]|uniref:Uncharacterized protein n=1 Tax=Pyrococcus abyssi (strain GE5 / Orsay) TaxID=272844 RepID=Q9V093_PYRAB|nr:hypothetical protein [Pyrococcus abyssi]CAB49812.1 Hypothetical protein PAB0602 [Pyrococcus abyssi GE5]CCE70305.1 TPA: hypothetical protein PAB0602 [Pyrococcus abyssi GE5]